MSIPAVSCHKTAKQKRKMVFLGFSPFFIFTSYLTTLLLDRGVHATANKQLSTSSPWYPLSSPVRRTPRASKVDSEALKTVLPLVTFDCKGKTGYFPDSKFNCEAFHYCQPNGARSTFHCPNNQLFNQLSMVCEEKNTYNSKICKEGSISTPKFHKNSGSRKHEVLHKSFMQPSLNDSKSKESAKKVLSLEDLLSYMNSGQLNKESEPTFMSSFHAASDAQKLKPSVTNTVKPQNSKITTLRPHGRLTTLKPEIKSEKDEKPLHPIEVPLEAQGSNLPISVEKTQSEFGSYSKKEGEITTTETNGRVRKVRKHKRVGRVLDVPVDQQPKKENEEKPYEQITSDLLTESLLGEITTLPPAEDVVAPAHNSNNPSLFSMDRNKAKDIRKRKRYHGRKRKVSPAALVSNDTDIEVTTTMSSPVSETTKQDEESTRGNNSYRRRKSQRTRVRDDSLRIVQKAKKVEPYTLPPLPIPDEVQVEAATESMPKEKKQPLRDGRSKNPHHKPTTAPAMDGAQFGEKLSDLDQHHYQTDVEMMEGPAPPSEYYRPEDTTEAYKDMFREDMRKEKTAMPPENVEDLESSHTMQTKKFRLHDDEDRYKSVTYHENHHTILPQNLFPPPRAEPREHHSTPPQQMMIPHESEAEKSKSHSSQKASTEDPFRVTHPYFSKYKSGDRDLKDLDEKRWHSEKPSKSEMKVEVGSTFFQDPVTPGTTKKPKLQVTSTTEVPVLEDSANKGKDMFKHTLAHQHLSKIMNDFFAMSSSNIPGRDHLESIKNKEELVVPEYRIPDEDIYTGAESGTEDTEELPQELLDVVDLLTGHVNKENIKPQTSHEIIKIDGPITDRHIEKIFLDEKSDEELDRKQSSEGTFKKIVILPEPTEDKEEMEDLSEMAEFTSLKLEPLLKHISDERSMKVIPLKTEPAIKRHPSSLTAKQIPVRVIYTDQLSDAVRSKLATRKPNVKIIQSSQTVPQMKFISNGKRPATTPYSHSFGNSRSSLVLHPSSIYPPHSVPSISRKKIPFRIGYPFVTNPRSNVQNSQIHHRSKRSVMSRLRRQIQQNQHFLPFSSPVFPSFNPKFAPTFSPFKSVFSQMSLRPSSSHLNPFSFPGLPVAKPSQNRPHIFQPSHSRPPPVRHITQSGHPTVIVEEVPVPIPVEVPSPNLLQPMPSGNHISKPNDRYPRNQYRTPSPPALQTPPLLQGPQHHRFPVPLMSHQTNNYAPLGLPPNLRHPPINYQSPIPVTGPLPPSITSQGQVYALGVTNKPIIPPNNPPPRPSNGGPRPLKNHPPPFNHFDVHANAYPNFPYFQGAFTTPISNEPVVGRLMYSGYKPPKSTTGTKPPKTEHKSNKERNTSESQSSRSRSKPTAEYFEAPARPVQDYFEAPAKPSQDYFEAPAKPLRESHVSYTEEVIQRERPRPKHHSSDYSIDHTDLKPPRQSISSNSGSSDEIIPRKRRPGKRRRPRPQSTTQGTPILNNISPTPPPPEQIPPPPADYTSKPSTHEFVSSLPISNEGKKEQDTNNHYPPAGYYGKDQLIQFFDSTPNSYPKTTSPKPYIPRELGEGRSTAERDESAMSLSEDGEPVFGTRLRSKPRSQSRNRQMKNSQPIRSQTQTTEVRTRPSNRPDETVEPPKKQFIPPRPDENNKAPVRDERPPPRRRKPPPPPRPRSRPQSRPPPPREVHHYKYNDNMGGFYSVPRGLQNFVAPGDRPQQGFRGSTDMFGIPHPVIDPSIYSLRPQGAPDFDPNFFSVPAHVAQEQQSPLRSMNIKPIPESAREFFTAPETESKATEESAPKKKEVENKAQEIKTAEENNDKDSPARKLRKPKRKNRYNPHSTEQRDSAEVSSAKPEAEQTTTTSRERTVRQREKLSTTVTTPESRSTPALTYPSQNDIKETTPVFKERTPFLPKTLPEVSKSLVNGKIDFQKLNATISTSVSVSGAVPQTNNTSSEEKENKRVFSSQNGGLAVVKKGPKRKRPRQRVSTTTGVPYLNNEETSADAKYEIAASVLDIIKATTETERQALAQYSNNETPSSSRVSNTWVEKPLDLKKT